MLASLRGKVIEIFPKFMILEVEGVGYKIEGIFPINLLNTDLFIFIHTHYSENDARLFGFLKKDEFQMFELLLTVSGVGPKLASTIIYNLGVDKISQAIRSAKPNDLKGNGVGLKTAQKIVIELASKIGSNDSLPLTILSKDEEKKLNEIEDALMSLGYSKAEVSDLNERLISIIDQNLEDILKQALNLLKGKIK